VAKVLFVIPGTIFRHEPLGVMYLSSVLKEAGHETDLVIDGEEDLLPTVRRFKPDVVGFSVTTGSQARAIELSNRIKGALSDTILCVMGGPHATFFPEVIYEEGVDGVCRGEGELAMLELANRLDADQDITNIANWWIKMGGKVFKNPVRPLIENVDAIPFPDRDLVAKYRRFSRCRVKHFITARGCPFNCSYCFNHAYRRLYRGKGKAVRRRSVDNVIEEIEEVRDKYDIALVYFSDDTFNILPQWVEEFVEKYRERIGLPFTCNLRADLVTPQMIRGLKEAGCVSILMGVETGNERLRIQLLKRRITDEQIVAACKLIKEQGMALLLYNILGLPTTELQHDLETLKFNVRCAPDYAWASLFQPFPRTELGELSRKLGQFDGDVNCLDSTFHKRSALELPHKREVENLHKLFALLVRFSFLRPLMKALIKVPNRGPIGLLYRALFLLWKWYRYKTKIMPGI